MKANYLLLSAFLFFVCPCGAGVVTFVATAPAVNNGDIANLTWTDTITEKVYSDASNPGQSFTTGAGPSGYLLKAVAIQINTTSSVDPVPTGRNYSVRVISIGEDGVTSTIALETDHIQTGSWKAGDWMTWTLDTPVLLDPESQYGIDIEHMTGGNWRNGIPYLRYNRSDDFAGGDYYRKADGDPAEINAGDARDFVFHLDLDFADGNTTRGLSITSIAKVGEGEWEVVLTGLPNTAYELRSDSALNFDPGILIENLSQGNPGIDPGTIGGPNDSVVTTDGSGNATVRVMLAGGTAHFLRMEVSP